MDRVALVTGAARGIGAATVGMLAGQGVNVLALDWCAGDDPPDDIPYELPGRANLNKLEAEYGDTVAVHVADVRDRGAMDAAVAEAVDHWGRLDVAVAAAALLLGGEPLWATPEHQRALLWDVNVLGVWNTVAAAVPAMLQNPDPSGCRVVAVASAAAHHGLYQLAGYTAAKHAVIGIVRGLAADLVGTGIVTCAVSPGSTDTQMLRATAQVYGMPDHAAFAEKQRVRRLLTPEEIAEIIAFCSSTSTASAALNGSVVRADGGFQG